MFETMTQYRSISVEETLDQLIPKADLEGHEEGEAGVVNGSTVAQRVSIRGE